VDQEAFNLSIRKFLKTVGVGSQREIEHAVDAALREAGAPVEATLPAKMTLEIPSLGLRIPFDGEIRLK
jgi:hypothetical protein